MAWCLLLLTEDACQINVSLKTFRFLVFLKIQNTLFFVQADKRAHHNALERKRRDHIKDSFHSLRDSVPALQGEKVSIEGCVPSKPNTRADLMQYHKV